MKLDMRHTTKKSCAIDGEGHMHRRGGMSVSRWVPQTEYGRYKTEREMGSQILGGSKISSVIRRERRPSVK